MFAWVRKWQIEFFLTIFASVKRMEGILSRFSLLRYRLAAAGVAALVLMVLTWWADRLPYATGTESTFMRWAHVVYKALGVPDRPVPDDIVAVNVAYDRQLAPIIDRFGQQLGERDVTNRQRLEQFLRAIKDEPYRAILIDIFFDINRPAEGDTSLIALINSMERTVLPAREDARISPMIDLSKTAVDDYNTTIGESDFRKYIFIDKDGSPSLALKAHQMAGGKAFTGFSIAEQPCMLLPLEISMHTPYDSEGNPTWYNLGSDMLDSLMLPHLPQLVKDRTIVIGDFDTDLTDGHGAYIGTIAGPAIHINALDVLSNGRHRINFWEVLAMALGYFAICLLQLHGKPMSRRLGIKMGTFARFCLRSLGAVGFLVVLESLLYLCFGTFHDMQFAVPFLLLYSLGCQLVNKRYNKICNEPSSVA